MSMRNRLLCITSTFTLVLGTFGAPVVVPLALASLTAGCGILGSPGPSAVSQGQKYQSGDPTFDEFFTNVYDLQIELAKAPESEKKIRESLAKKVKLDEGSSASMLSKKLGKRTEELAAAGTGVKLEVKGLEAGEDASADMSVKGKDLEGDDKEMVDAIKTRPGRRQALHPDDEGEEAFWSSSTPRSSPSSSPWTRRSAWAVRRRSPRFARTWTT